MKVWRSVLVLMLLVAPLLVLGGVAVWTMWQTGVSLWLWWLLPICWALAYLLARRWQSDFAPLPAADFSPPNHWTPQDEQALKIVQAQQQAVHTTAQARFVEPQFYLDTALDLSLQIARHYHPRAKDPLSSLTVPEILAAAHLAFEDLENWVRDYVPASHLLTVQQWRMLGQAPGWLGTLSNIGWAISVLAHPTSIARYLLSRWSMQSAGKQIQANLLAWFYVMFVRQVGVYAIEMNSGRLREGADRYRDAMSQLGQRPRATAGRAAQEEGRRGDAPPSPPAAEASMHVTIAVVGQAKAGKSSLINALLGQRRAQTDVLPRTRRVEQYDLALPHTGDRLTLLDTAGYSADETTAAQIDEMLAAFGEADLVLLVMDATTAARRSDLGLVRAMAQGFARQPRRKPPPVLGVLTHIDGLTPVREWSPPYDWQRPATQKEQYIQQAIQYNREQFGDLLAGVIPACTDVERQRVYGVEQWLLPAMLALLDEARGCAVLRSLQEDIERGPLQQVLHQLRNAGSGLIKAYVSGELSHPHPPVGS